MKKYFIFSLMVYCSSHKTSTTTINSSVAPSSTSTPIIVPPVMSVEDASVVDVVSIVPPVCPSGMVEVNGDYCSNLEEICLKWGDPNNPGVNGPVQCLEFKYPTKCLSDKTIPLHYCIDEYPYPYDLNEKPATNMTWYAAQKICKDQGKRLCETKEYRQACRGPENKPYPYGYVRDCSLCNCDRVPWLDPATHTFAQLDKRVPIKDILQCKSDYGVIGLVGNTDRWVHNELFGEKPFRSGLCGGHPVLGARNRCTPITLAHSPDSQYYEFGQPLCCQDIK